MSKTTKTVYSVVAMVEREIVNVYGKTTIEPDAQEAAAQIRDLLRLTPESTMKVGVVIL